MENDVQKSKELIGEVEALLQWVDDVGAQPPTENVKRVLQQIEVLKEEVNSIVRDVINKNPEFAEKLILKAYKKVHAGLSRGGTRGRPRIEGSRKSELSEFIVQLRSQMNLSQVAFQKRISFEKAQYVSKVESGNILIPNDEFLQKLSVLTGRSYEELRKMATNRGV